MNNIKLIGLNLAVISAITIGFSGCGSSDGTSGVLGTTSESVSGNVADGYLVGATVCLDKNNNKKCDTNEPNTKTTINGKYTLNNVTSDDMSKYSIFVEVDESVIDEDDNQSVSQYYTLTATPGQTFISPISTMIRNYEVLNDVSHAVARTNIEKLLGIKDVSLSVVDYIASDSPEAESVHNKAKIIANLKMKILTDLGTLGDSTEANIMDKYINDKIMEKLSDIKIAIDSNSVEIDTSIQNIMGLIDTSSVSSELNTIKNDFDKKEIEELELDLDLDLDLGTTLHDLTSSTNIKQDTKYSKTYKGGTDLKTFTIEDSSNKLCTMYILETTNSFNPNAESYKINGSDYSPEESYSLGVKSTNNKFSISWMYYTTVDSHVDFYVNCKDVVTAPTKTLSEKYSLDIPTYTNVKSGSELFMKRTSLDRVGENDENLTVNITTNKNEFIDIKWAGVSLLVNDTVMKSYTNSDNITPKDIDSMLFTYDTINKIAYCTLKDKEDTVLEVLSISNIEEDKYGNVKFGYFMGKINIDSDSLIYKVDTYRTLSALGVF